MSEWISVSKRLPPAWTDVLVYCKNRSIGSFEEGEEYVAVDRFCIWQDEHPPSFRTTRFFGEVTHWMPLPAPPKEKKED